MFGIGDHKGVTLPQLVTNKLDSLEGDHLTVNGTKSRPVKPYSQNLLLPHITQKSQRPVPRSIYHVSAINTAQGSMLEAIEIYRRARVVHTPDQKGAPPGIQLVRRVPCPTPIDPPLPSPSPPPPPQKAQPERKPSELGTVRQPTKLLPVSISLQKRLERLAKLKTNMTKKSTKTTLTRQTHPKLSISSSETIPVPTKAQHTTHSMHYTFNTTLLPKIQRIPRQPFLSYQLLEIPARLAKPERKRVMFAHSDYDVYQHTKFSNYSDRKLSIVGGPESRLNAAVWDYNKFLYLNVKI